MTKLEYDTLFRQASRRYPYITRKALSEIKIAYQTGIEEVSAALAKAGNIAPITIDKMKQILELMKKSQKIIINQINLNAAIDNQLIQSIPNWWEIQKVLNKAARNISEKVNMVIPDVIKKGAGIGQQIHEDYLIDMIDVSNGILSEVGIHNMFFAVNDKLIANIASRIWQDGYSYSQRIWGIGNMLDDDIKRVVLSGLAQGRDAISIAKDLNIYVNEGYQGLMKRYGQLIKGTTAFSKRIRQKVYYPSLRLVRSELYAGLQDNAKYLGMINPACTGMYRWVRNNSEDWNCECPEYAQNSPYRQEQLPGYPHPNCLCSIIPILMDSRRFAEEIKAWSNGENIPYIENWYNQYYSQFAAAA